MEDAQVTYDSRRLFGEPQAALQEMGFEPGGCIPQPVFLGTSFWPLHKKAFVLVHRAYLRTDLGPGSRLKGAGGAGKVVPTPKPMHKRAWLQEA